MSVIHVHGTADKNIPYDDGEGSGPARIDGPAVPNRVAHILLHTAPSTALDASQVIWQFFAAHPW